jgi:hypothetical protein
MKATMSRHRTMLQLGISWVKFCLLSVILVSLASQGGEGALAQAGLRLARLPALPGLLRLQWSRRVEPEYPVRG